jgi:type 1 fimbriae regulatory protein FimB/type 1 fimbriae regulatory protein FimE
MKLRKPKNKDQRAREHLLPDEVERLIEAAQSMGRHSLRDSTLILLSFRHGLRVGETVALTWDCVDFAGASIYISRLKNGKPATHPLKGVEMRALKQLQTDYPGSRYLFANERGGKLSTGVVRKIVTRAGEVAGIRNCHPHQLRHACGYFLASKGFDTRAIQDYLGHRSILHTVRYTELAPDRFKDFWQD